MFPKVRFTFGHKKVGLTVGDIISELATQFGVLATPGDFFGSNCAENVRIAAVQPESVITLLKNRVNAHLS